MLKPWRVKLISWNLEGMHSLDLKENHLAMWSWIGTSQH